MIYRDRVASRRSHDAGSRARTAAKLLTDLGADVVFTTPVADPLFTYLRTSQRHAPDPAAVGRGGRHRARRGARASSPGDDPLVTVSITPVGHGGPDDGLDLTEEVLQARSGSLSAHGHARPHAADGRRHLGEYVTGAFAALGAATAWWRASRTGVAERVDVSMLEAMQLTFVTVPTLMTRFPGGRLTTQRWVMIPGNEPTGDGRFVGITTVTDAQWLSLCRLMGRDDLADDDELTTMMGRGKRADEVNAILHGWTRALTADEVVGARASRVACRRRSSATAPSCRSFEQLVAREVFVRQPGEDWIRPRAPFRFHGVPDRELVARSTRPASTRCGRGGASRSRRAGLRSASARSPGCACSTSPRSGPGRSPPRGSPRWART